MRQRLISLEYIRELTLMISARCWEFHVPNPSRICCRALIIGGVLYRLANNNSNNDNTSNHQASDAKNGLYVYIYIITSI